MDHYAGIDVSLEYSAVCIVDGSGNIFREAKVASEPEALIGWFSSLGLLTWSGSGWKPDRCRNGFMRRCGKRGWRWNCWRPATCVMRSRRCR